MIAFCSKCNETYSIDEYQNNRFCEKCDSLLKIQKSATPKFDLQSIKTLSDYSILSVMGSYAGESEHSIFERKMREIEANGYTFWHIQSIKAQPQMVQKLGISANGKSIKFILTTGASSQKSRGTQKHPQAKRYRTEEKGRLSPIPRPIYVETGSKPWALVIKNLEMVSRKINLWNYSDFFSQGAIRNTLGGSTICAIKKSSRGDPMKMKSNVRDIVAIADLVEPFSVWLST
jgi:hypothetical protein